KPLDHVPQPPDRRTIPVPPELEGLRKITRASQPEYVGSRIRNPERPDCTKVSNFFTCHLRQGPMLEPSADGFRKSADSRSYSFFLCVASRSMELGSRYHLYSG